MVLLSAPMPPLPLMTVLGLWTPLVSQHIRQNVCSRALRKHLHSLWRATPKAVFKTGGGIMPARISLSAAWRWCPQVPHWLYLSMAVSHTDLADWLPSNRALPHQPACCREPSCPFVCCICTPPLAQIKHGFLGSRLVLCSQDKAGHVLTQANLHQNQQIVRGFRVFGEKNEVSNLTVRICFLTDMSNNWKTLQRPVVLKECSCLSNVSLQGWR